MPPICPFVVMEQPRTKVKKRHSKRHEAKMKGKISPRYAFHLDMSRLPTLPEERVYTPPPSSSSSSCSGRSQDSPLAEN